MNKEIKKFAINVFLAFATFLLSFYLWRNTYVLVVILVAIGLLMLVNERDKTSIFLFIALFILGPLAERYMILAGAWKYTSQHLLEFPIWLPFLWGNMALFIKRLGAFIRYILKEA